MTAASRLTAVLDAEGVAIPFSSGADDYGVDWRLQKFEGWDSAELEEAAQERSGQDGMWDSEPFFGGRTLSLEGKLYATSYEAREAAEYRLREAVPRNSLVQVLVNEVVPKWVWARRSGRLMVRPVSDVASEWSISMLAPDPRKYGGDLLSGPLTLPTSGGGLAPPWTPPVTLAATGMSASQVVLTNVGIYPSPPTITLSGPGSGLGIRNYTTGLTLSYDLTLAASDYLLVDVAGGVALLNGTSPRSPATGSCVTSDFLLVKGDNLLQIIGTATGATPPSALITCYSAWT